MRGLTLGCGCAKRWLGSTRELLFRAAIPQCQPMHFYQGSKKIEHFYGDSWTTMNICKRLWGLIVGICASLCDWVVVHLTILHDCIPVL